MAPEKPIIMEREDGAMMASLVKMLERSGSELEAYQHKINEDRQKMEEYLDELKLEMARALSELRKISLSANTINPSTAARIKERYEQLKSMMGDAAEKSVEEWHSILLGVRKQLTGVLSDLSKDQTYTHQAAALQDRIHKLRMKLDMYKIRFRLGAMDLRDAVQQRREQFNKRISKLKKITQQRGKDVETQYTHFRKEMAEAYKHLSKAFAIK